MQRREVIKGILSVAAIAASNSTWGSESASMLSIENKAYQNKVEPIVINAGIGGNNTIQLLDRIDKDCLAHHPKLTVLMIGTNDMNSQKYVPLEQFKENLLLIVKKIKQNGSKVLLLTILPAYEPYLLTRHKASFYEPEGPSGRRNQLNNVIKQAYVLEKVDFLDMEHRFKKIGKIGTDNDSLIKNLINSNKADGIHPTSNGYRFIALSVYDYILDHDLAQTDIVCFGDSITYGNSLSDSYPGFLKELLVH